MTRTIDKVGSSMSNAGRCVWITWETQRRNREICSSLGWKLYEMDMDGSRMVRYARLLPATIRVLARDRPAVVAVQNPSIVLAWLAVLLRRVLRFRLIVDAHSSGIHPLGDRSRFLRAVSRRIQRSADLTLVTTGNLKRIVEENRGRAFVLPDKLPEPGAPAPVLLPGRKNIVCICSFAEDEPYREVLASGRLLDHDIVIHMTGRHEGRVRPQDVPANVRLLGFVPEAAYWSHLRSADFVMDLTRREECLVCGAYEGLALGKPLILSDTKALRSYFSKGCVYVSPNAASIAEGIRSAMDREGELSRDAARLRAELAARWADTRAQLESAVATWL